MTSFFLFTVRHFLSQRWRKVVLGDLSSLLCRKTTGNVITNILSSSVSHVERGSSSIFGNFEDSPTGCFSWPAPKWFGQSLARSGLQQ